MKLYHYRPIASALLEIGDGALHFSAREELNDPIEGYVRVFWQGDKAAWEGLFKNYICSVNQAIDLYLLQGNENMLHHKTLVVDLHLFDNVPLGGIWRDLGDKFLADRELQRLAAFYGDRKLRVDEEELQLILEFIHKKALILCIQKCLDYKTIPSEISNKLLEIFSSSEKIPFPFDLMEKELSNEKQRAALARTFGNSMKDITEFQYVLLGFDDENFLYGKQLNLKEDHVKEDSVPEARQRRNWMSIVSDFPKIYINQLKDLIYPESYVVCFSRKNNDSAMWGNYADRHQGVCLVYDTNELNVLYFNGHNISLPVKPVNYGGDLLERNFFETLGRLTIKQITTWLTGTEGLSSCYEAFSKEEAWRDRYWEIFEAKTYRKLKTWEHENEYRIVLPNTFYEFNEPQSRNLQYEYRALKGIIFGINTSEYDKKRIMEMLLKHADELLDFTFYQAEYNSEEQRIKIREKSFWKLKK